METIAIYYIATNVYCEMFDEFINSLKYFMPNYKKIVVLLSDSLHQWNNYVEPENHIEVRHTYITNYPWPVITLYKHYLCSEHKIDDADYCCYCNADTVFNKHYNYTGNEFDFSKVNLTYHTISAFEESTIEKANVQNINCAVCSLFYHILQDNPDKPYCQASFFFAKSDLFYSMCDEITEMVFRDVNHNFSIMRWQDESYLNCWALLNEDKCNYKQYALYYTDNNIMITKTNVKKTKKV